MSRGWFAVCTLQWRAVNVLGNLPNWYCIWRSLESVWEVRGLVEIRLRCRCFKENFIKWLWRKWAWEVSKKSLEGSLKRSLGSLWSVKMRLRRRYFKEKIYKIIVEKRGLGNLLEGLCEVSKLVEIGLRRKCFKEKFIKLLWRKEVWETSEKFLRGL